VTEKRAGRPVLDFLLATFTVGVVMAVLSIPLLMVIAGVVLLVLWIARVGA